MCISLLSKVGENVSVRMRYNLFSSILEQDLEFFDKNRTGDILQRLFLAWYKTNINNNNLSLTHDFDFNWTENIETIKVHYEF